MANPNDPVKQVEEIVQDGFQEIAKQITGIFIDHLTSRAEKIDELSTELEQIKSQLGNFINPEYGMLPVPASLHEYVMELARQRSTAPGVIMTTSAVAEFLQGLIEKEIL